MTTEPKRILPCWNCGKAVALNESVCPKCGDPQPARGTPGGKVPLLWKGVLAMTGKLEPTDDVLAETARAQKLTVEEVREVLRIMRGRA